MSKRCAITGKGALVGNHVSHANNKTKRRFLPNLQTVSLLSDALRGPVRLRVSAHAIRTIEHNGGLDPYLLGISDARLSPEMRRLKRRIDSARRKAAA
ncbi:MAG: 50S ribosomal protein L28 [Stellaceae bacterium]